MNMRNFSQNSIGKKMIMAFTGIFLVLFVILHLLGNLSIFFGPDGINAYTERLHSFPALVWGFRLIMIVLLSLHIYFGISLYLENKGARPIQYKVKKSLRATFASKNMIWTGTAIAVFLIYHLLHFTIRALSIRTLGVDSKQRPDIFSMVLSGLTEIHSIIIYAFGLIALFLHLYHGIQSLFQTMSLSSEGIQNSIMKSSRTVAVLILIAYLTIPAVILAGILKY